MRVLLINKFHYHRDGATAVYFGTAKMLNGHGHDTAFFAMDHPQNRPSRWSKFFVPQVDYNDDSETWTAKAMAAFSLVWNFQAQRNLSRLIRKFQPDVAHLHVIYHQLTPAIIHTLKKHQIPVVMTHHDFKMISPVYNLALNGQIYEKTKAHKYYKAIPDKAIKNSFAKSLLSVLEAYTHKLARSYHQVDIHISPSRFLKRKFREYGISERMEVVNNPYSGELADAPAGDGGYILYAGRLSAEKGLKTLLSALAALNSEGLKLYLAGSGPLAGELKKMSLALGIADRVEWLGHLRRSELDRIMSRARAVVVPSECYENFSMTIIEAQAKGKVVVASDLGGNPELVEDGVTGYLFPAGDVTALTAKLEKVVNECNLCAQMGKQARQKALVRYGQDAYIEKIIHLYEQAIEENNK